MHDKTNYAPRVKPVDSFHFQILTRKVKCNFVSAGTIAVFTNLSQ